jgi:glyoxylase-like metal-dependent hydrolase (beta-lactamase superfamily II)
MTAATYGWTLLRAGSLRLDGGGMFGVVPKVLWSRLAAPDELNRVGLQTNCLLLDDGSVKVLVETGFGSKWSPRERGFYDLEHRSVIDALREIGVAPDDIDHVVVTHLHFDHAAGLTHLRGDEPVPSFPRATIHVQKTEWEDALANKSTMSRTYLESHLRPVADRVRLVQGAAEVLPGLGVKPVPGHTWGQQAVSFDDGEGRVCFPGDVIPTVNHVGLAFSIGYDMMPYQNMLTKRELLAQAAAEGWRLVLDHEPGEAVVRVRPDPEKPGQFRLDR